MAKYVCTVCGYGSDPSEGDPDGGIAAGTAFGVSRMTGYARFAALQRICSSLRSPKVPPKRLGLGAGSVRQSEEQSLPPAVTVSLEQK